MSYLINESYVRYECTCGTLNAISRLYFCRHCLEVRCCYCVCQEVDSHYCSNCMENFPSAEAKARKNRCNSCFDCPNCFQTLSIRATTRHVEEGAKAAPKHYYLSCFFCRWTTRDVGIPDQLSDKFGLTSMIARKRAGLPSLPLPGKELNQVSLPEMKACEAEEEVEPLPQEYLTTAPDLTKVTTIAQRHANPMLQPEKIDDLHPQQRHFFIKRSLRCRKCEHNVSKPEYHPGSVKFKIQHSAYYHIPEVRIMTFEPLRSGEASEIILKVSNPTQNMTTLQFSPYKEERKRVDVVRPVDSLETTASAELPSSSIILPQHDDAAEYAEASETQHFQDDPKVVVWRRGNKAAIKMKIVPNENLECGNEVIFAFSLEFSYINTMTSLESKTPQRSELQVNVFVNPGQIVGPKD